MLHQRLQRIIARAGITSRRAAEQLILSGRVRVNGALVTTLGTKADPVADKVEVDGRRVVAEGHVYLVMNKPRGVVSTVRDPEGRATVRELLGSVAERIFPVGRLDYHTSGVLLLTNDGDFFDALTHPKRKVPKTYVVKVAGEMREADRKKWSEGVAIDGRTTDSADVHILRHEAGKTWLELTLFEGKNQQIRRMGEATGFPVMRLSRTSFGGITSDGLRPGSYRPLTLDELTELRALFGVPRKLPRPGAEKRYDPAQAARGPSAAKPRPDPRQHPAPGRTKSHRRGSRASTRLTARATASTRKLGG
jgi:23S rRNA pseudouridine2605 synthase